MALFKVKLFQNHETKSASIIIKSLKKITSNVTIRFLSSTPIYANNILMRGLCVTSQGTRNCNDGFGFVIGDSRFIRGYHECTLDIQGLTEENGILGKTSYLIPHIKYFENMLLLPFDDQIIIGRNYDRDMEELRSEMVVLSNRIIECEKVLNRTDNKCTDIAVGVNNIQESNSNMEDKLDKAMA